MSPVDDPVVLDRVVARETDPDEAWSEVRISTLAGQRLGAGSGRVALSGLGRHPSEGERLGTVVVDRTPVVVRRDVSFKKETDNSRRKVGRRFRGGDGAVGSRQ